MYRTCQMFPSSRHACWYLRARIEKVEMESCQHMLLSKILCRYSQMILSERQVLQCQRGLTTCAAPCSSSTRPVFAAMRIWSVFLDWQPLLPPDRSSLLLQSRNLKQIQDVLGIRLQHARSLLIHHRWDVENLFSALAEQVRRSRSHSWFEEACCVIVLVASLTAIKAVM